MAVLQQNVKTRLSTLGRQTIALLRGSLGEALQGEFPQGNPEKAVEPTRRPDMVMAAIDHISSNLDKNLTAEELADAIGATYRNMHYAFTDSLTVSPYQFILIKRLHAVRDAIINTDISVKDACYNFGFDTPSRFRKQYKRLFGELPSETRELSNP